MPSIQQVILTLRGPTGTDPNFASVVLLVPWNGTDGQTTATDLSNSAHTLTFQANAQIDTAQSWFGGSSLLLDGDSDRVESADSADWLFSAGDWTMEAFIRINSFALEAIQTICSHYSSTSNQRSWWWRFTATGMEFIYSTNGTATTSISGSFTFNTGTWYYVAAKRSGTSLILYAAVATDPSTTVIVTGSAGTDSFFNSTTVLRIGSAQSAGVNAAELNGWTNQTRITKGVARDVSSVPTAPFPTS